MMTSRFFTEFDKVPREFQSAHLTGWLIKDRIQTRENTARVMALALDKTTAIIIVNAMNKGTNP